MAAAAPVLATLVVACAEVVQMAILAGAAGAPVVCQTTLVELLWEALLGNLVLKSIY